MTNNNYFVSKTRSGDINEGSNGIHRFAFWRGPSSGRWEWKAFLEDAYHDPTRTDDSEEGITFLHGSINDLARDLAGFPEALNASYEGGFAEGAGHAHVRMTGNHFVQYGLVDDTDLAKLGFELARFRGITQSPLELPSESDMRASWQRLNDASLSV